MVERVPPEAEALILVVEDDEKQARPFVEMLQFRDFNVKVAYNGTDALAMARKYSPNLVIVDLLLVARGDEMDGYDVIRSLRNSADLGRVSIMAWSAHYIKPQDEIRALRAGADTFVLKDLEYGVLEARIEALLRRGKL